MDDLNRYTPTRFPTASRPLLGMTILVIEDSRYACDALRLLCLRSGARIRRADCLASARRHLQVYRPSAILIDLGLPDGSGLDLIEELADATPRVGVLLGMSADESLGQYALDMGADGFLAKPISSVSAFQEAILAHLPADRHPGGPRALNDEQVEPDPLAYREDMHHIADIIDEGNAGPGPSYVAQFLTGVASSAKDTQLLQAAEKLARAQDSDSETQSILLKISELVQERMNSRLAI